MIGDAGGRIAWRPVLVSAVVGMVGGFAGALVVTETVFAFRTAFVGAVCVGLTGGVLSGRGVRGTVVVAGLAEAIRSLVLLLISGLWALFSGDRGSGFVVFYLLVGGGVAFVVAVVSVPLAAAVGGVTAAARSTLRG